MSLRSLRGRLAALLGLAFLPAGAVAVQAGMTAEAERRAAVQQSVAADEIAAMGRMRDEFIRLREAARSLAANAELFADNRARCQATMQRVAAQYEAVTLLTVLTRRGEVLCANDPSFLGDEVAAQSLLMESAAGLRPVIGFDPQGASFIAVAPADLGAEAALFVGVRRPAELLLDLPSSSQRVDANLVIDGAGRVLLAQGFDAQTGQDLNRLLSQTAPAQLSNAQRSGGSWFAATELEPGALYIVHGWRPPPPTFVSTLRAGWTLLAPVLLWLAAVGAAWYAIELFVARPLLGVERLARAYARGEESEIDEEMLRNAPLEMRNLRRTLAAMAKTLRGREARITEALQEERVLLREVHHRVKNNLQMVASILSIQARSAEDEAESRGLARAKDRVQMLALAHARIYASGEVRDIALDQLAGDVARQLIAGRGAAAAHLRLEMTLDPVRADVDRAVAFAFMIGESVSNVIDHVLSRREPTIMMSLLVKDDRSIVFEVRAEPRAGEGPPAPATQRLVDAFASQLGAQVERDPGDAVFTRITVPPEADSAEPLAAPSPPAPANAAQRA